MTGNLTTDFKNQYHFHGNVLTKSDSYRHCVGLQRRGQQNVWKLRTVHCRGDGLPINGYICEYSKFLSTVIFRVVNDKFAKTIRS